MIIDHTKLLALANRIVTAGGSSPAEAAIVAGHLVEANLRGHDSHGVGMLVAYVRDLEAGTLKINQAPEIVSDTGTISSWVVYHRVYHPEFKDVVPYIVGRKVRLFFEDCGHDLMIPQWKLIAP